MIFHYVSISFLVVVLAFSCRRFQFCDFFISCSGSALKTLPAVQETQVQYLGGEDPLENEMATHSSCLGYAMERGAWQATVHGIARVRHDLVTKQPPPHNMYLHYIFI